MSSDSTSTLNPVEVAPATLKQWLDTGRCVLVDVREDAEHREEHIAGSASYPLSSFDPDAIRQRFPGQTIVFHCKGGKRSAKACAAFAAADQPTQHLAGGIDAWKSQALPTVKPQNAPRIPIMRQVQIAAGLLVALGTLLSATVSMGFLILPAFIGCGLVFAGATGWCGMARLLGQMPWNR